MNDKTFKNFKINSNNKEAFNKSKEFLSNNRGLFLFGSAGSGKSHLAKAAYNELKKKYSCKFISMPELLLEIRETFRSKSSELAVIDYYTDEQEYLFLDDLGAEKISEYSVQTVYLILSRWERRFETKEKSKLFITSNYDLDTISKPERMGDRISSRIVGTCVIQKMICYFGIDEDYRLHQNEKQTGG